MKKDMKTDREPKIGQYSYDEFFNNRLSIPKELKDQFKKEGLTWRFINAAQFRAGGNMHRSHWKPYKIANPQAVGIGAVNAEGMLQRGDLVLATRPNSVNEAHKDFLKGRNAALAGYNKQVGKELRSMARDRGMEEHVKIHEGYEETE